MDHIWCILRSGKCCNMGTLTFTSTLYIQSNIYYVSDVVLDSNCIGCRCNPAQSIALEKFSCTPLLFLLIMRCVMGQIFRKINAKTIITNESHQPSSQWFFSYRESVDFILLLCIISKQIFKIQKTKYKNHKKTLPWKQKMNV